MKAVLTFVLLFLAVAINAQTPQAFKYQAVLRNASGQVLANRNTQIEINLLLADTLGTKTFTEVHDATTNGFGLVNLDIGSVNTNDFENINWANGPYFIQVVVDGEEMGVSQLLSVPYALQAENVVNDQVDDADADPTNELQTLQFSDGKITLSDGGSVLVSDILQATDSLGIKLQDISLTGTKLTLSQGSTIDLSVLQDGTGTDNQTLSLINNRLYISNGNRVILPYLSEEADGSTDNELQSLSKSGLEITLSDGGGTVSDSVLSEATVDAMVANNGFLENESDPTVSALIKGISEADTTRWGIDTNTQLSDGEIGALGYIKSYAETDPEFAGSVAVGITNADTANWNNKLAIELDPAFTNWDKSTGINITESQISDLQHFTNADETDPTVSAWVKGISEADTTRWGIDTNTQLSDGEIGALGYIKSYTETDPQFSGSVAAGISPTDTANWNNKQDQLTAGAGISITNNKISTTDVSFAIGDSYGGGIIFWLDPSGKHGLIAAVSDQHAEIGWDKSTTLTPNSVTNAIRDGIGGGMNNSERIEAKEGVGDYAASLCSRYQGGGYGDWYLPSKYELNLLFAQRDVVGGFSSSWYYWSSTELNGNAGWAQNFANGQQFWAYKLNPFRIRAIRKF